MVDRVSVTDGRGHTERFLVRGGRVRKLEFSIELIDDETLERWLDDAGFEEIRFLDRHGDPYTAARRRRITIAKRRGAGGMPPDDVADVEKRP